MQLQEDGKVKPSNYELPSEYQKVIHLSKYSRYLPHLKRRETWVETVDRLITFLEGKVNDKSIIPFDELREAILNLEVMPSMRLAMSAGEACERDNIAAYNCSYLAINNKRAFSEALYILMNGTGVGFSCERDEINKLPALPDEFKEVEDVIVVGDSKLGWAKAFKKLLSSLWEGDVPTIDYSRIRPAGARLKTFGGRASGPEPLKRLFEFAINTCKNAAGRKLNSLEVHDLMCMIGEVVVVGGVRRSALISLSNLTDKRMRDAKTGAWYNDNSHRSLANNSVAYTEKPDVETFMDEWLSLVKSKSGERGIFNRKASQKQAAKWGRRNSSLSYGTNPCCTTGDTLVLTDKGEVPIFELVGKKANVWNGFEYSTVVPFYAGEHKIYEVVVSNKAVIKCTANHKWVLADGTRAITTDLLEGDVLFKFKLPNSTKDKALHIISVKELANGSYYAPVYCFEEPKNHTGTFNGIVTGQSEIILRDKQFCNLTEVVVRQDDTYESLSRKVRLATILGTIQSTLTTFQFLSEEWKKNTEEERLLGVSLTGIMDNKFMSGEGDIDAGIASKFGHEDLMLKQALHELRDVARSTNEEYAKRLGVEPSAAITCVKPSGTVSQLVDSASGIHSRHSKYYIRRIRMDKKDPIYTFLKDSGIPVEDEVFRPDSTAVFSFPMCAPSGAVCRTDKTAIEQLELWLLYSRHWCEHKPSVTITVKDDEWPMVGAWVWEHFDEVSGVSFLPFSNHTYQQAPYTDCTKEEYEAMLAIMPSINWAEFAENDDNTIASQELSCMSGQCDI